MLLNFNNKIEFFKECVDEELLNIYIRGPKLIKEPLNHIISGGKRLRPSLCLLICDILIKILKSQ